MKNKEPFRQPDPESPEEISRRIFMARAIGILGLGTGGVLAVNVGRYFLSPAFAEQKEDFVPICSLESLPKGQPLSIEYIHREKDGWEVIEGRNSVWLVRGDNDEVTAFNKSCTHLGCPYAWSEQENKFKCPCHTATFAMTGEVLSGPPERPLDRFPVKVENGMVLVKPETIKEAKS